MGLLTRGSGVALLTLAVALAGAPFANARPAQEDGPAGLRGFPITVDTTVPAGGRAWVGSPSLPARARSIELRIATTAGGQALIANLYTTLAGMTNKNRLLFCATIGLTYAGSADAPAAGLLGAADPMQACFGVVALLTGGGRAKDPRARCPQAFVAVPVSSAATGIVATGPVGTARRPLLRIRCSITSTGVILRITTRAKKSTLRSLVGERLTIGFSSRPGVTGDTALTLTYGKPR